MKPDRLQLTNWMCHRHLDLPLTPLTLVGGGNDRGKSTIRDAFAFALSGETARITAKSERPQLITEGESKGAVALTIGPWTVARNIKDGKAAVSGELPLPVDTSRDVLVEVLPYCLAPERWVNPAPVE